MDGGAWKAAVHGVAEGRTQLSNFTFPFHFHALVYAESKKVVWTYSQNFAHSSDYQGYFIYNDPSPVQDWLWIANDSV